MQSVTKSCTPWGMCAEGGAAGVPWTKEGTGSMALEGKGPQQQPGKRLDRRLEEVAEAVGGGYCRLQMPLRLALGVRA